jgi:hypothetical protein
MAEKQSPLEKSIHQMEDLVREQNVNMALAFDPRVTREKRQQAKAVIPEIEADIDKVFQQGRRAFKGEKIPTAVQPPAKYPKSTKPQKSSSLKQQIIMDEELSGGRLIRRRGYTARRRGVSYKVPAKFITDRGAPGKWQSETGLKGIGPLKKGELTDVGYRHTESATRRHAALKKAIAKYGRNSTIRKLNAIATYTKRTAPSRSRIYRTDMHFVQKSNK